MIPPAHADLPGEEQHVVHAHRRAAPPLREGTQVRVVRDLHGDAAPERIPQTGAQWLVAPAEVRCQAYEAVLAPDDAHDGHAVDPDHFVGQRACDADVAWSAGADRR